MTDYREIVEKLRTNCFSNDLDKSTVIKTLIGIANLPLGRLSLYQTGICDFICEKLVLEEDSIEFITDLCVLIGYLSISDICRPILFKNNVVYILVCALKRVGNDSINYKLKIVEAIKYLCQEKMIILQLIEAGILSQLCSILEQVSSDVEKKLISFCIYRISYLAEDKMTAVQCGCIDLMYRVAESISSKSIQSEIFTQMNYFISNEHLDSRYPIYRFWRTDFQTYLNT